MNLVQYRMARGALNWTSRKVSVASGVQLTSISALQSKVAISEEEMSDIRRAIRSRRVGVPRYRRSLRRRDDRRSDESSASGAVKARASSPLER